MNTILEIIQNITTGEIDTDDLNHALDLCGGIGLDDLQLRQMTDLEIFAAICCDYDNEQDVIDLISDAVGQLQERDTHSARSMKR